MNDTPYTTQLGAGLGLIEETEALIELWQPGMSASELNYAGLESGRFPNVTARRLRNIIIECFAPRYLVNGGAPARHLKLLGNRLSASDRQQLFLLFTCRANPILADFIRKIYWERYAGGYSFVSNEDARAFIEHAIDDGRMRKRWSESMVTRVSGYLTGCCADYGLLEQGRKTSRWILPLRIAPVTAAYLAYDLHLQGLGDNAVLAHDDWGIYGLRREEVLDELKKLALKGFFIVQAAGEVVKISWRYSSMEKLCNVLVER